MLTRELVESLFDIKDGEFYHKPKSEVIFGVHDILAV